MLLKSCAHKSLPLDKTAWLPQHALPLFVQKGSYNGLTRKLDGTHAARCISEDDLGVDKVWEAPAATLSQHLQPSQVCNVPDLRMKLRIS